MVNDEGSYARYDTGGLREVSIIMDHEQVIVDATKLFSASQEENIVGV
jgi:hypothetical protein